MKNILRYTFLFFSPFIFGSCYNINLDIGTRNYYDENALRQPGFSICPYENIKIKGNITDGIRYNSEKKEIEGLTRDYKIVVRKSNGVVYDAFSGTTNSTFSHDWNTFGLPPGITRLSLFVNKNENWEEKDYVKFPIQNTILPVTVTLNPEQFNQVNPSMQYWTGIVQDIPLADRSSSIVIDNIRAVGGHPNLGIAALEVEWNNQIVGIIKPDRSFDSIGNTNISNPNGLWRVKLSERQPYSIPEFAKNDYEWKNATQMQIIINYRCSL